MHGRTSWSLRATSTPGRQLKILLRPRRARADPRNGEHRPKERHSRRYSPFCGTFKHDVRLHGGRDLTTQLPLQGVRGRSPWPRLCAVDFLNFVFVVSVALVRFFFTTLSLLQFDDFLYNGFLLWVYPFSSSACLIPRGTGLAGRRSLSSFPRHTLLGTLETASTRLRGAHRRAPTWATTCCLADKTQHDRTRRMSMAMLLAS